MNHCSHQVGHGRSFLCSNPSVHASNNVVWNAVCAVCPFNDNGTQVTSPKYIPNENSPGSILKGIIESLGIKYSQCDPCGSLRSRMDQWGPQECRKHLDVICEAVYQNYEKWKVGKRGLVFQQAAIATKLLAMGIIVNPLDPIRSLVLEAIRRAEKQSESTAPP